MTLLFIALSIILLLILILAVVFIDEYRKRKGRLIVAKMDRYWDGNNRREFIRTGASLQVCYKVEGAAKGGDNGVTNDIGEGGIGVVLSEKFSKGNILNLEISLPDGSRHISAKGRISWIKESYTDESGRKNFDAGIEFLKIQKENRERLIRYIKDAGKIQR